MKKIILITFLSFFISSVSYSSTKKDIIIGKGLEKNSSVVLKCKSKTQRENISVTIIYKNMNPGVVFWSQNEEEFSNYSFLASYLFFNKSEKNSILYQNLKGVGLVKYFYSTDEMYDSFKTKNKFSMYQIGFPVTTEEKNSIKLYKEYEKILPSWFLKDLILPNRLIERAELKKLEDYSNTLKELFEKQYEGYKNNKFGEKLFVEKYEFICDPPKFFNIKP
jgi:hypothetical protein